MMTTANMSGYSANIPGAFIDMCSLQNCSMRFPINSSKVALHARATLEVPEMEREQRRILYPFVAELQHPFFKSPMNQIKDKKSPLIRKRQKGDNIEGNAVLFTDDIGEDEVPSSDERPELPYCHIGVQIS